MRNLKRFLAMTLTMLMVVGCFVMTSSAKFDDVTDFQNEITILSNLGVIKGLADGTFGFDQSVTRRQEALFIARAATGKVTDTVWTSTVNNSAFKDLDATGDYYGAISYCANLGIIKGRTTTEFYPNDNIIFQEAVAMAVRALGYGSATMDAGYPYTFYDKAVSLGLDKGLEDVALTDVVSRGVAAKLLYNTLFAVTSDGVTLASTAFGATVKSTNLVLIATDSKKLVTNYTLPTAAGTVAFCEFNSDGSLNLDKTYNLNWSNFATLAFGDATKKAADFVGASFAVTTIDGFKTLASVAENTTKTYTQADATGSGTIAGTAYTLVDKWSTVFTTGTTFNGGTELIQFNTAYTKGILTGNTAFYGNHWYVVDDSNNIKAADGSILLYYMPTSSNNTVFPFCYKIGTAYYPAYLPVDGSAYAGAATVDQLSAKSSYATNKNDSKYTSNVSAYADTVAYDDDNDGTYDRAYFTAYTFGQFFTFSKDGHTYYNVTLGAHGDRYSQANDIDGAKRGYKDISLVNISGKDVKDGSYVLWAVDAINGSLIIKKVFDKVETGYVTGVNVLNKTISVIKNLSSFIVGTGTSEAIKYGVAKLPGATNTTYDANTKVISIDDNSAVYTNTAESLIGISYDLQYKSISYIVDDEHDNKIIAIIGTVNADTPLVITSIDQGFNTLGYIRATVIDNNGTSQIIDISKIDSMPVINWYFSAGLHNGELVYGAKQSDGTWLINTNANYNHSANEDAVLTFFGGYAYENATVDANGNIIAMDDATIDPALSFKADGSKLVIIVAKDNGTYQVATGIPTNGSTLTIPEGTDIFAKDGYMYVYNNGESEATFSTFGWNLTNGLWSGIASDIIYLKATGLSLISSGIDNSGYNYTYAGEYVSVLTGSTNNDIGAYITSRFVLTAGNYYAVSKSIDNGTTVLKVVGNSAITLSTGYTSDFGSNYAVITDENGLNPTYLAGKEILAYNWSAATGFTGDQIKTPALNTRYTVLYYSGSIVNGSKQYLLVTDKTDITPVVGTAITGVTTNAIANPVSGTTISVTGITTKVNGVTSTLASGNPLFDNATFMWYKVATDGTATLATLRSGAGASTFLLNNTDANYTIKVVVFMTGYTPNAETTANTATTGLVILP